MAWAEMSGSRKSSQGVAGNGARYIEYEIAFRGAFGDAAPSLGDLLTAIDSGNSLSSTGLAAEPAVVQVSDVKKAPDGLAVVTCRFQGWFVEA